MKNWDRIEKWIAALIVFFSLCLSFYSVLARYIFHLSLDWSDEVAVYEIIWAVFFGISSLIKTDEHVRVDLFIRNLSPKRQNIIHLYHALLGLAFVIVVDWGAT